MTLFWLRFLAEDMDLCLLGVSFDNCYLKVLLEADFEVLKYLNML